MEKRLTKRMYYQRLDGQTFHESSTLFGLQNGRICEFERVLHDARWYNRYGEKLGWGDLVPEDFERIASGLKSDELFIILRKVDMYRDSYVRAGSDEDHPPLEYLLRECLFIIRSKEIFEITDRQQEGTVQEIYGIYPVKVIHPHSIRGLFI
ncbi:MAG: hypothetical protein UU48_C0006G0113 [Candidatus Uhrbacteria bacterium GW2011_GWF2_41_16]|uniref:Uncharacterized protein n=2 Tax=Candidatus Uhriibacteriota TaxID=1752732 RepID=A0A0G0VAR7_9BACT|nr:MAG: hypothetical protein UU35_C0007G0019 [Candidatus Uhrbacteria bacterium GW2011_GWC2_41_11]KKR98073.1 MAG: hypothetical protein UU48_C0006G0113 [Candidatus Uhrbacteria bacterium GW2011_GWF2_41_16]HBO99661.1 hypothetical protein [Candidatus Uhrbacteria bacterium]